jgi:hypothetical protein
MRRRDLTTYGQHCRRRESNKKGLGIAIIVIGLLLILHKTVFPYFEFRLTWPYILIIIGLLIGIKNNFRNPAAFILIGIGAFKLIPAFPIMGVMSNELALPALLIIIGLLLVFRRKHNRYINGPTTEIVTHSENSVNIDVTLGGKKEIITSKDFRGGNVSVTFAGCELNLTQADSTIQPMELNLKVVCSGVELIVPSHWEIRNEIETTMGSVEDHRTVITNTDFEKKTLVLTGSCSFGSIEIKSY